LINREGLAALCKEGMKEVDVKIGTVGLLDGCVKKV
jgi:hypothetical protein